MCNIAESVRNTCTCCRVDNKGMGEKKGKGRGGERGRERERERERETQKQIDRRKKIHMRVNCTFVA